MHFKDSNMDLSFADINNSDCTFENRTVGVCSGITGSPSSRSNPLRLLVCT